MIKSPSVDVSDDDRRGSWDRLGELIVDRERTEQDGGSKKGLPIELCRGQQDLVTCGRGD